MHVLSTLALSMFAGVAQSWSLQDDYGTGSSFFEKFTFFTVCSIISPRVYVARQLIFNS